MFTATPLTSPWKRWYLPLFKPPLSKPRSYIVAYMKIVYLPMSVDLVLFAERVSIFDTLLEILCFHGWLDLWVSTLTDKNWYILNDPSSNAIFYLFLNFEVCPLDGTDVNVFVDLERRDVKRDFANWSLPVVWDNGGYQTASYVQMIN